VTTSKSMHWNTKRSKKMGSQHSWERLLHIHATWEDGWDKLFFLSFLSYLHVHTAQMMTSHSKGDSCLALTFPVLPANDVIFHFSEHRARNEEHIHGVWWVMIVIRVTDDTTSETVWVLGPNDRRICLVF
jgi:hypothetical protein